MLKFLGFLKLLTTTKLSFRKEQVKTESSKGFQI